MKTARFSQVVAKSGKPEPYTLWTKPDADPTFKKAVKEHRVMTVHQPNVGTRKDYGTVGFQQHGKAAIEGSLWVFPKSLKAVEGRRIVGISYDLLTEPPQSGKSAKAKARPAQSANKGAKTKTAKGSPRGRASPKAAPPRASEPLRLYKPEQEKTMAKKHGHRNPVEKKAAAEAAAGVRRLTQEIRKALKQLEAGKAVAAYQTLEAALGEK
jgi:hypothetical protein